MVENNQSFNNSQTQNPVTDRTGVNQQYQPVQGQYQPTYIPPMAPVPPHRNTVSLDKFDCRLIIPTILIGFMFFHTQLLFGSQALNVIYFVTAIYLTAFCYKSACGLKASAGAFPLLAYVILFTLSFGLFNIQPLRFFCFLFLCAVIIIQLYMMLGCGTNKDFASHPFSFLANSLFAAPFSNLFLFWRSFSGGVKSSTFKKIAFALLGILIAFPLTIILITALSSADAAFETLVHKLFGSISVNGFKYFWQLIFGIPIAMLGFGILCGFRKRRNTGSVAQSDGNEARIFPSGIFLPAFIPIILTYILYLFSQIAYFFSAFSNFLPDGFTYAGYARRGFFELCIIAFINLFLITLSTTLMKPSSKYSNTILRVIVFFISIFSLVIISTAISKMIMYMSRFGLTQKRIWTSMLMLGLGLIFIAVIIRQLAPNFKLARATGIIVLIMMLAFTFTDADALIANYNADAYLDGRISDYDVDMLSNMSDSVILPSIRVYEKTDDQLMKASIIDFLTERNHYPLNGELDGNSFTIASYYSREKLAEICSSGLELD